MEVHHPHHPTHKKKWSEYIVEFIMLFAAVTLGFFAENVREHQVIEQKTKQNLQSIVLDLSKDSLLIVERIREYENASKALDELNIIFLEYQSKKYTTDQYIDKVLLMKKRTRFGASFYMNNSSYKNTIASGSFSNIQSIELKRKIADYYEVYGAKLNDNNRILDDIVEYYTIKTLPLPGGRLNKFTGIDSTALNNYYKSNGLFTSSLLSKDFIVYNQKALDRIGLYLLLMNTFQEKNRELISLLRSGIE
ncbi:MAG: hypothetical protein EBU80_06190 [Chitinophagia bacterium]|nr:hypothetical protein [Chitinophagia bacterium]